MQLNVTIYPLLCVVMLSVIMAAVVAPKSCSRDKKEPNLKPIFQGQLL
jgi:hypothetical protein